VATLIYAAIASLDGYVADAEGSFEWAAPDEEVHAFVNELERPIGTYLYGRRMYEVMAFWEDAHLLVDESAAFKDFAEIWQGADKIVFSRTLKTVSTARTRLEHDFDPAAIRELKAHASHDITVGGAELGGQAIAAGLVDEIHLFLTPVLVGSGTSAFPDDVRARVELLEQRRFGNGVVHLRYRVAG
jgi:dihydrofolate reductase